MMHLEIVEWLAISGAATTFLPLSDSTIFTKQQSNKSKLEYRSMIEFIRYIEGEWVVVKNSPFVIITSIALSALILWSLIAWGYSNKIESLEARIKLKDDQIGEYKDKLNGATPVEAKSRIEALEIAVKALSPRRLTEQKKMIITNVLSGMKANIEIGNDMAVADTKALQSDFALAFQAAGWGISLPSVMGIASPPPSGLGLQAANVGSLRPAEALVKAALEKAGVKFDIQGTLRPPRKSPTPPPGYPSMDLEPAPDVGLIITTPLN